MLTIQVKEKADDIIQHILEGSEHIVSHPGTSQYGGQKGISACGLASLNFARVIFAKEASNSNKLLQTIIASETAQEITAICAEFSSDSHLEVDDIHRVPLFNQTLQLVETRYGRPTLDEFTELMRGLKLIQSSCVVIITRPPEIIACMKLVIDGTDVFVIFDSHSRPGHPDGAVFILNTSIHRTAAHLKRILPVDHHLLSANDLQWQAQLLAHFSGHIFISGSSDVIPVHLMQTVTESSLVILTLRAQVLGLTSQNSTLTSDVSILRLQNSKLTSQNERLTTLMRIADKRHNEQLKSLLSPSRDRGSYDQFLRSVSAQTGSAVAGPSQITKRHSVQPTSNTKQQPNEKNRRRRGQNNTPAKSTRHYFECRICMEEHLEDSVASIDSCGHRFCRECVRNYVGYKLGENRFPILCPLCMADHEKGEPGIITNSLVHQIGITEKQYETWVELEMAQFSILLHCRECKRSTFVDRYDLQVTKTVVCPLPDCPYMWCKSCQQQITLGGPDHSCDGSSELDHLMKENGWKYCPSCKTPFQKETGCNHMTCMSPGCNTHFCYFCGDAIIKSALPRDIQAATETHFRKCRLFEDVADHDIPP